MTGYDLFALGVVLISAAAGWIRGGAREAVTLIAFALAAFVALVALPLTGPLGRGLVDPPWAGSIAAAVVTFLIVYFGIRIVGAIMSRRLREHEHLGGVDRSVGVMIGAARALVLLGAIHLVFHAATPPERVPGWFRDAAVFPVSATAARVIQTVLPGIGRSADQLSPVVASSVRDGFKDDGASTAPQSGATGPTSEPDTEQAQR